MNDVSGYADDEVSEILGRALATEDQARLTHAELAEIAAEVGISPAQLEQAAAEVRAERLRRSDLDEARQAVALKRRRELRRWLRHLSTYIVITAGLALLDAIHPPMGWWFYPAIAWGMVVALRGSRLLFRDEEAELRRELRRIERKRKRAERAAKKRGAGPAANLATASTSFEAAIERGLALLLAKAAEKIDAAARNAPPADTDFGRFVAAREGVPTRVAGDVSPRVRVGEPETAAEVDPPSSARAGEEH